MSLFRDLIVFLAGAEFFHTLSHIFLGYYVKLPLETSLIVVTPTINTWATIANGIVTLLLLWWAKRLSKR